MTHRSGVRRRTAAILAALTVLGLAAAAPLPAQIGHAPDRSPYRDLITAQSLTFSLGHFSGNTAKAGVGWRGGSMYGVRLDTRLGGPIDLWVSVGLISSSRFKINTTLDTATRKTGPFTRSLVPVDLGFVLNLTGAKTWHGLAPYVGFGAGELLPTKSETDVGGYNAGVNFTMIPAIGTRIFFSPTLAARIEVRDYFFRYEWPLRYFDPVDSNNLSIRPAILPYGEKDKQWVNNLTLTVGFVYGFNF